MAEWFSHILMIFFFFIPFLILLFSKWIEKQTRSIGIKTKTADLVTPYLLVTTHIFSVFAFDTSAIPYVILVLSIIGIALASYFYVKEKELTFMIFFRVWWRYVFLLTFLLHLIVGVIALYNQMIR